MPRRPDPDLEGKILDAAQKLWKKGGEKALTMRTVARAAGTNTPAVYRRFRDRDDISARADAAHPDGDCGHAGFRQLCRKKVANGIWSMR